MPLKIYSYLCSAHNRSSSCLGRTSCSNRRKSQMVLIDLNKCWSEHWSRMKETHLIMRAALFSSSLNFLFWLKQVYYLPNYLGSFVKATATRREEITYILSKFMRTMFTEPLQNNRFSLSFVFGNQTFWHFLFRDWTPFSELLFVCTTTLSGLTLKCPPHIHHTGEEYLANLFCNKRRIWNKICLLEIVTLHNIWCQIIFSP